MIIFAAFLGLIAGSFLNAFYYRKLSGSKKSIGGRSLCPKCGHTLGTKDLVPVVSYLFLQGKCRYCKKEISVLYPTVELITAFLFALVYFFIFGPHLLPLMAGAEIITKSLYLLFWFYIVSVFILIVISDIKEMIIPDEVIYPAIIIASIVAIAFSFSNASLVSGFGETAKIFGSALVLAAVFYLMILISKGKWMGGGDVKLVFLTGLILGWPNAFLAVFLAFILGSLYGLILISAKIKTMGAEIPFGPFIIMGTLIAFFWGSQIINWYLGYFL
jgi:leader peptidase (prepilin peptidase) / N-methyltransferase